MDTAFLLKLSLSFILGGVWVTLSTLAAERFGSKIGGLIGGLPSTAFFTLLFIGLTQSTGAVVEATTLLPLVQGLNGPLLIFFILLAPRGLVISLGSALLLWAALTGLVVISGLQAFGVSVVGWLLLVAGSYWVAENVLAVESKGKLTLLLSPSQLLFRALFAGAVVAFAVWLGRAAGPIYGGVFGVFPATFISTLVITHRRGGAAFSRAVAKSLLVSGLFNVAFYAILVRYLYPLLGIALGTVIALALTACTSYLTYLFLRDRVS